MQKISRACILFPANIIIIYILASLTISLTGPIVYSNFDKAILSLYALAFIVGMFIIYLYSYIRYSGGSVVSDHVSGSGYRLFNFFCIVILSVKVVLVVESITRFGFDFQDGVLSLYINTYALQSTGAFSEQVFSRQVDTLFTAGYYFVVLFGLSHWNGISKINRLYILLICLLQIFYTISFLGDQKPILDLLLLFMISQLYRLSIEGRIKFDAKLYLYIFSFFIMLSFLFGLIIYSRIEMFGRGATLVLSDVMEINPNNYMIFFLSDSAKIAVSSFFMYPTMGWYGLSLALQSEQTWSYGLGSMRGINSYLSQYFDIDDFYKYTYLYSVEEQFGYDGLSNWHTIFPWLASDFGFIGALLIVLFAFYFLIKSWRIALERNSIIYLLIFFNLLILFLYLPANNQVFHLRSTAVASLIIFTLPITSIFFKKVKKKISKC